LKDLIEEGNMPIYEYRCNKCGEVNEFLLLGKDEALSCTNCNSPDLVKLISAPNISSKSDTATERGSNGCCGTPNSCGTPGSCCAG
jgi:putative FmdB family regulatory protein